jgi:hypothetical protein
MVVLDSVMVHVRTLMAVDEWKCSSRPSCANKTEADKMMIVAALKILQSDIIGDPQG